METNSSNILINDAEKIQTETVESKLNQLPDEKNDDLKAQIESIKKNANDCYYNKEYENAMNLYCEALMMATEDMVEEKGALHSNLGLMLYNLKNYKEAIIHCTKALEYKPNYIKVLIRRALYYEANEEYEEAIKDHQKIIELDPSIQKSYQAIPVNNFLYFSSTVCVKSIVPTTDLH